MSRKKSPETPRSGKTLQMDLLDPAWQDPAPIARSPGKPPVPHETVGDSPPGPVAARDPAIPPVFSVTDLIADVNTRLRGRYGTVWVEGELGRINEKNGIYYFSLKDSKASLDCVLFARTVSLAFEPKEGMQVLVRGYLEVFAARGKFSLYAELVEPRGEGALLLAFLQLKKKLETEGLFSVPPKKLPLLPRTVGIVTSYSGAALQDILKIARRRVGTRVLVSDTIVQGTGAPPQIISALMRLERRQDVDVIIIARGGGSMEDLACFNDEALVRAVHACPIPVVSAVGHQTDTTLVDFVADVRAATPTEAAEIVFADPDLLSRRMETLLVRCSRAVTFQLERALRKLGECRPPDPRVLLNRKAVELNDLSMRMDRVVQDTMAICRRGLEDRNTRLAARLPQKRLSDQLAMLERTRERSVAHMQLLLSRKEAELDRVIRQLDALSPLAVLERGYSVVTGPKGEILRNADRVGLQETVSVRLWKGRLDAVVTGIDDGETPA